MSMSRLAPGLGGAGGAVKITNAKRVLFNVSVGKLIADSMQKVTHLEFVGCIVSTDAGIEGTGYTVTVGRGGHVLRSVIDTLFADELLGENPQHVRQIWQKLYYGSSHWIGRAGAT